VNYAGQVSLANCSKVSKRTIGQPWVLSWIGSLHLLKVHLKWMINEAWKKATAIAKIVRPLWIKRDCERVYSGGRV
jgi:hypothetical protein